MPSAVTVAGILCRPHPLKWHLVCRLPSAWFHVNAAFFWMFSCNLPGTCLLRAAPVVTRLPHYLSCIVGGAKWIPPLWDNKVYWLTNGKRCLKQHYVTLTATHCFEKRNQTIHVSTSHKTAILVKPGHILLRKCRLGSLWCSTTALSVCSPLFQQSCHQHLPRLQLQLRLQAAYMLLSGTFVNHRVGAEQL